MVALRGSCADVWGELRPRLRYSTDASPVVGWFALVGPAVASMAVTMYVNDDPNASGASVVFMVALGLVFLLLALFVLSSIFRERPVTR